jgi:hypothetical protein
MGNKKMFGDMLSHPPTSKIKYLGTLMHIDPFTHDVYKAEYT